MVILASVEGVDPRAQRVPIKAPCLIRIRALGSQRVVGRRARQRSDAASMSRTETVSSFDWPPPDTLINAPSSSFFSRFQ